MDGPARARHHRDAIAATVEALRAAPDATVPFYPEWRVRDLVVHVSETHTRGCLVLEQGATERPSFALAVTAERPVDELADEVTATGERLRRAVETCLHPEVWTYGSDRSPGFWLRRMLMEATLHRWDAESAAARPRPVPREVALDGVPEFLDFAVVRKLRESNAPLGGRVTFEVGDARWVLDMGNRAVREGVGQDEADTSTISGDPERTWLWLNRRLPTGAAVRVHDSSGSVAGLERFLDRLGRPADLHN